MKNRLATAVGRLLLIAYPRAFRARFGDELTAVFVARLTQARSQGLIPAVALALWLALDALLSGSMERVRSAARRSVWPSFAPSTLHAADTTRSLVMSWESIAADARLALRQVRRAPVFAAVTVLTLALGVGANSAIFSIVYTVLLRPLPYADPDRLVAIWSDNARESNATYPVSPANFTAFAPSPAFAGVEAMYSFLAQSQIRLGDAVEMTTSASVTAGMFDLIGRAPLHGRTLRAGDEQAVVLGHAFWQRRFGGAADVVGRPLQVVGAPQPLTIVGVMPEDFIFPYQSMLGPSGFARAPSPDMWRLLSLAGDARLRDPAGQPSRTIHLLSVVARLAPDVSIERARTDLAAIAQKRATEFPDTNRGYGVTVRPLHDQTVGAVRPAVLLLLGGVGLLLLMTCTNVANVLLARESGRQRDIAVRSALGASRARLAQQSLVESTLLAAAGGLLGCALVLGGRGALLRLAPADLPRLSETAATGVVLGFTMLLSLATGLVVGALPAFVSARTSPEETIRQSRRATASASRRRVRSGLVVAELALATSLTVGGGVLLRSFIAVLGVKPGFDAHGLLTFQVFVPTRLQQTPAAMITFYDDLMTRLVALPGVGRAGGSTRIPLGSTQVTTLLTVDGRDVPATELPEVGMRRAVGDYFSAMSIPTLQGRVFTSADRAASVGLAVINESLAARVFPGENPIGRRVRMGSNPAATWLTIVGTVGSVRHGSLEEAPKPEIYISHFQGPPVSPFIAIRTHGDPAAQTAAVRRTLADLGADPPFNVRTMDDLRQQSVGQRRFVLVLVGLFGALALALAAVGVYGVIALVVSERTAEVGVRLALGATPHGVLSLVVGQALRLAIAGILIGAAGGALLTHAAAAQLFGISPVDPITFGAVTIALLGVAALAALAPARRAMRVDPATALRN